MYCTSNKSERKTKHVALINQKRRHDLLMYSLSINVIMYKFKNIKRKNIVCIT